MSNLFSEEMKNELIKLIDRRILISKLSNEFKVLNERVVDIEDNTNDFENDINDLKDKVKEAVKGEDLEEVVSNTMLKLIPNFNERIAKEIKRHLVTMAEFVIENFKEKE
jgi:predicted transcriptional regulator